MCLKKITGGKKLPVENLAGVLFGTLLYHSNHERLDNLKVKNISSWGHNFFK
jgi:hypothetical protein